MAKGDLIKIISSLSNEVFSFQYFIRELLILIKSISIWWNAFVSNDRDNFCLDEDEMVIVICSFVPGQRIYSIENPLYE